MAPPVTQNLRADAQRNRRLILDAAREVFAESGLEGSFEAIARRAGVGVGTVYRRFPEREDLIDALFAERVTVIAALAAQAAAHPDPWQGLVWFLERSVEAQSGDRGLREAIGDGLRGSAQLGVAREEMRPALQALVTRVQACGALRSDFEPLDLAAVTAALCELSPFSRPDLWRRYLVVILDGMRETNATPLQTPAPTEDEMGELVHPVARRRH